MVLFLVIFLLVNGGGILYFYKKRKHFFNQSNKMNEEISMRETPDYYDQTKYKQMSILSSSSTDHISYVINSEKLMTSTPNIAIIEKLKEHTQSEALLRKKDIDLKEFQRQALQEHNSIRTRYNKPLLKLTEALNIYAQVRLLGTSIGFLSLLWKRGFLFD
jgi:hypothetical protein